MFQWRPDVETCLLHNEIVLNNTRDVTTQEELEDVAAESGPNLTGCKDPDMDMWWEMGKLYKWDKKKL